MIPFNITDLLLVDACHVVMHLHTGDRIQHLLAFTGFQWWTEQCFFVFVKGVWNVLSRNKTHYAVIHWSIACPSCKLHDSHCFLSTGALLEAVPPHHSPGHFCFCSWNAKFISNWKILCSLANLVINFSSFLPSSVTTQVYTTICSPLIRLIQFKF